MNLLDQLTEAATGGAIAVVAFKMGRDWDEFRALLARRRARKEARKDLDRLIHTGRYSLLVLCGNCDYVTKRLISTFGQIDDPEADREALARHFATSRWGCDTPAPAAQPDPETTFLSALPKDQQ